MYRLHSFFNGNLDKNGFVYSVDKVVLKGQLFKSYYDEFFNYINSLNSSLIYSFSPEVLPFGEVKLIDILYKERFGCFCYRNNFNFIFQNTKDITESYSFYFGLSLFDTDIHLTNWKLEFNPNKVGEFEFFIEFLNKLLLSSKKTSLKICEFDIAVDMPLCRSDICMIRTGRRSYSCFRKSRVDFTEYLGVRHSNGYVKLYNKCIESGLDYDLTRLEITLDSLDYSNFEKYFPNIRSIPKNYDFFHTFSETDFFVLYALLQDGDLINCFSKRTYKQRYLAKLDELVKPFEPSPEAFENCITYLLQLIIPKLSE